MLSPSFPFYILYLLLPVRCVDAIPKRPTDGFMPSTLSAHVQLRTFSRFAPSCWWDLTPKSATESPGSSVLSQKSVRSISWVWE